MLASFIRRAVLHWLFPPLVVGYKDVGGTVPYRKHSDDAGWDIYTSKDTTVPPHQFVDVPSNIYLSLPAGVWGRITGRSSTIRKWGIRGGWSSEFGLEVIEGIIDTGYTGELFASVINHSDEAITICKGDRLAQIIFHRHVDVMWEHKRDFPQTTRGSSGFGSTGRNGSER